MRCAAALSTTNVTEAAFGEVLDRVTAGLDGTVADLAVAFVTPQHAGRFGRLASEILRRGLARHVLGCTGESIAGEGREIEGVPGVSLWAITLPGARLTPFRMTADAGDLAGLAGRLAGDPHDGRLLLALGDPFTFPADDFLALLNEVAPGLRVAGGMASGSQAPGGNRLLLDGESFDDGAVAILIDGPAPIRTVVSQGCRPIGRPLIVTKVDRNMIQELGRRPAVEVFREIYEALAPDDQALVRGGLHVGRVINEYQETFDRGDFLVRNVMGADESGAIAITDRVRVGQTVQFHVRDAATAEEDLRTLLAPHAGRPVAGALLFTCNGRGTRLFDEPDHDAGLLRERLGPVPAVGFFAMGELGPIGGQNFIHGFTASVVLFEDEVPRRA